MKDASHSPLLKGVTKGLSKSFFIQPGHYNYNGSWKYEWLCLRGNMDLVGKSCTMMLILTMKPGSITYGFKNNSQIHIKYSE